MMRRFSILLLLIGMTNIARAQSPKQEKPVFIDLNSGFSVVNNSFTDTWDAHPAVHLNFRIPFYAGQLETGFRYTRFEGMAPSERDSDFHSIFIHVGYNYPIHITPRYQIAPAVRFGINNMLFDQSEIFINKAGTERFVTDKHESEFAYELALRNQFKISEKWYVHATFSYNRTLTFFPLPVTLISAGLTYSFQQPTWLKNFIK